MWKILLPNVKKVEVCHHHKVEEVEVKVLKIDSGKISLSNKSDEERAKEAAMDKGISVEVSDATLTLEYALRKAGIAASMYPGTEAPAVEEAAPAEVS